MTRIAIFCDGTWNSSKIPETTSIHKLQSAVQSDPSQGQVAAYFAGVGTDARFKGRVGQFFNKWGGGAFGWGLDGKVKEAYEFICKIYSPGDELYFFGFSRGAYTARSVAGMIRKCGIATDTTPDGINAAFELYRRTGPENAPDQPHIRTARKAMSPNFATSQKDADARGGADIVKIAYVGVWETVGAQGIPPSLLGPVAGLWNRRYKFHDMALSSLVKSARHALALDEQRALYTPALWDNLDNRVDKTGLNSGDVGPLRPFQQVWFVGDHKTLGGAGPEQPLSVLPLEWIVQGAGRLTLKSDVRFPLTEPDPLVPAPRISKGRKLFAKWRLGPQHKRELHASAQARADGISTYRPGSLRKFFS
ncbi:MAG: hypothetical protein ACI9PY_002930 [Ascidiaceihabitans sp.]|jgi:uncharacterized protein (DUF2235 family)